MSYHVRFILPKMMRSTEKDSLEPLVFAILSGLTPCSHDFYDERIEKVPLDDDVDLVAMSVSTFSAKRAYELADHFRSQNVRVVMGGYHPTLCPDEALLHADAIVTGDAESTWPQLLADAQAGRLQRVYTAAPATSFSYHTNRSAFEGKSYGRLHVTQMNRGCVHSCDFCAINGFYGSQVKTRALDELAAELSGMRQRHILFADDNIFHTPQQFQALTDRLIPLELTWISQISLNAASNPAVVEQLRRSGCRVVGIGFESLVQSNLKQMGKRCNGRTSRYIDAVKRLHDNGIMVYGTFVFGYDGDTTDSFKLALDFALKNRFFLANFNPLIPLPGTPLYLRLRSEKRLVCNPWWLHPGYRYGDATFLPHGMTAHELETGCYRARTEFHKASNILQRSLLNPANRRWLGLSLLANYASRKQIHSKQGCYLGCNHDTQHDLSQCHEAVLD